MDQLPVFLNLKGKPVLVIGKGSAADAKRRLVEAAGGVLAGGEANARFAFIALDDDDEVRSTADRLRNLGLLVNVVDRPELCDFTVPAIVDRSPVIIAIGTGGTSATLAKTLRERLEALLPASLGALAEVLRSARTRVTARYPSETDRRLFWDSLLAPGGGLDPTGNHNDPAAAIDAALAGALPCDTRIEIEISGADADDLTLRQLRSLSRADVIVHDPDVPASILDRARRDARRVLSGGSEALSGHVVTIRWTGG